MDARQRFRTIFKPRSLATFALLALLTPLLMGSSDLREDQFECEQAVSHMVGCCPASFDPTKVDCEYDGCGGPSYPSLSIEDSECIEQKSCDQVLQSGLCDTVENLDHASSPGASPGVCQ